MAPKSRQSAQIEGFSRATIDAYNRHRIFAQISGEPGCRKTTFGLEGPGPVAVFSLDQGLEGVVNKVLEDQPDKEIQVWEREWYPTKDEDLQEKAIELRDEFATVYEQAVTDGHFRTVLLDKEPDFWALYRYAEFGSEANGEQRDYDALNSRYRRLINMGKASNCNIIFICGLKDKWGEVVKRTGQKGKGPTGDRIPAGFKELNGLVHMELRFSGFGPESWALEIGKMRGPGALALAGQTFTHGEIPDFKTFAQLVFPDSEESEWA